MTLSDVIPAIAPGLRPPCQPHGATPAWPMTLKRGRVRCRGMTSVHASGHRSSALSRRPEVSEPPVTVGASHPQWRAWRRSSGGPCRPPPSRTTNRRSPPPHCPGAPASTFATQSPPSSSTAVAWMARTPPPPLTWERGTASPPPLGTRRRRAAITGWPTQRRRNRGRLRLLDRLLRLFTREIRRLLDNDSGRF
jgi:hypothetical protein